MDLERVLISKILYTGQVEAALSRSITTEHFYDDECRELFAYIVDHARRYKSTPSLDAVRHDRPTFEFIQTPETIEWVVDRFTVQVKRKVANEMLIELSHAADDRDRSENIDLEFLNVAHNLVLALPTGKVERFSDAEKRIEQYETRKAKGKLSGIPYGYPTLDQKLGGIRPHELVTVLGFTNVGKSTLLRSFAFNFWIAGYTPLFFSLEMEAEDVLWAFDAMAAHLDYEKLRQLKLDDEHMKNWRAFAKEVKRRAEKVDIPIIDSMHRITPEQVYAETLRHKPDIVIIDYVGLMRSSSMSRGVKRYQQLAEITQDLKINARLLKTPIIMAAQTNRSAAKDGAELENVADAISIAQDSDTVIGMFQDEDMERDNEMELRVNKSRHGPRPRFKVIWRHETQEFRQKTMTDMFGRQHRNGNGNG